MRTLNCFTYPHLIGDLGSLHFDGILYSNCGTGLLENAFGRHPQMAKLFEIPLNSILVNTGLNVRSGVLQWLSEGVDLLIGNIILEHLLLDFV